MRAKFLYRYNGLKINDGWKHPVTGVKYKEVAWFDSQSPEQLQAVGVTRHDIPVPPEHDSFYQMPVEQPSGEYAIEDRPLAEVQAKKKSQLLSAYEQSMQAVRAGYSESEIASWVKQENEALAWTAWVAAGEVPADEPSIPLLIGIAAARGVALSVLVDKVLQKSTSATQYIALQTGTKQALEDAVDACETGVEVKAVEWPTQ